MLDQKIVQQLSQRQTDIHEHLLTLFNLVVQNKFKNVVEIGAGQSTYVFTAAVNRTEGQFWSIDLYEDSHLRDFPEGKGLLENEPRYHKIVGDDIGIVCKWKEPIDFLFIDSSHLYAHTLYELTHWSKFVPVGGIIAMHDVSHKAHHINECQKALDEYLAKNPGVWSVAEWPNCQGLTVLTRLK